MKHFALGLLATLALQAAPPRIAEPLVAAAIEEYAPILVLHRDERYLPTRVDEYLKLTEPYPCQDAKGERLVTGLRFQTRLKAGTGAADPPRGGAPAQAMAYVNVKVGAASTDLQYWFLYAYNGPSTAYLKTLGWDGRYVSRGDHDLGDNGAHEGDWEHLTVTISNATGKAVGGVYMGAHGQGGAWPLPAGGRVRAFASRNGHACYPAADRYYRAEWKLGLFEFRLVDDTSAPGLLVDFRHRTELVGIQGDAELAGQWQGAGFRPPPYVTAYGGRWGRVDIRPHPLASIPLVGSVVGFVLDQTGLLDELTVEAGPFPPWSKDSWQGPE